MFRLIRIIQLAMKSLLLHKLRSGLTMLGIVFGVFSVIAMLSIGEGASQQAQKQVLQLGATNVIVMTVKPPYQASDSGSGRSRVAAFGLKREDFRVLQETLPTLKRIVPIREASQEVRHHAQVTNARIVGCTGDYLDMNHLQLARGRFINQRDLDQFDNVAVLSAEIADLLFRFEDPMTQAVKIGDQFYTVIGVARRAERRPPWGQHDRARLHQRYLYSHSHVSGAPGGSGHSTSDRRLDL